MCSSENAFTDYVIHTHHFWRVELNCKQCYLGWCLVILIRHVEDLFYVTEDEWKELYSITKVLRDGLKELFGASKFNYSSLGNKTNHVHFNVIPRYDHEVEFAGMTFYDKRWGHNYKPYDKEFVIDDVIRDAIVNRIKEKVYF